MLQTKREPPVTADDWLHLEIAAKDLFSPHAPIDEQALFAGRSNLIRRLIDVVWQRGQHAILYGDRGVGKTSLANIIKEQVFGKGQLHEVIKRNCTTQHDFKIIWQQVFYGWTLDGKPAVEMLGDSPTAFEVYQLLGAIAAQRRPIIILDEFDRIRDKLTHEMIADTIKQLADESVSATIIIVGVAQSVSELFGGHESIHRNVQQVPMPRMAPHELSDIFFKRMSILGMSIDQDTLSTIVKLSQGLPGYTHLLGQHACVSAIERQSVEVSFDDLLAAMKICVEGVDETVREGYHRAVRSTKPLNKYREALLACALAETNDKGFFSASSVREPFSMIVQKASDIPSFARHLQEFCSGDRGPTLIRVGKPKSYEYRFADGLLRPYVIIRGLSEGMLRPDDIPSPPTLF